MRPPAVQPLHNTAGFPHSINAKLQILILRCHKMGVTNNEAKLVALKVKTRRQRENERERKRMRAK